MDCDFSPSSPHLLPNGLFSPQNRISFELLALSGLLGFSTFKGGKMLIFQGFANSRIVREFPPFSFKVRIATLTRNQLIRKGPWVRIPPSPPLKACKPCGCRLFLTLYASFNPLRGFSISFLLSPLFAEGRTLGRTDPQATKHCITLGITFHATFQRTPAR